MQTYLEKVICRKILLKNYFFVGVLKVNDENGRIRIGIHTKMSWIRNTDKSKGKNFHVLTLKVLSSEMDQAFQGASS